MEFVKPAFVVLTAWLFNESQKRPDIPGIQLAVALYAIFAVLLILQPDFGQTLLVTLVWGALFYMAGINMVWIGALGLAGAGGVITAYLLVPHVASRIDRFFDPASGDTYQTDRSLDSFLHGGWFGRGPGEGTVKNVLPDSHTDFIFAVTAEEYGLIDCLILLTLFAFIELRGLSKASQEPDGFIRHAVAGLIMLFGLQALINMAVNVGLLPAKGMTLPFSLMAVPPARHGADHGLGAWLTCKRPMAVGSRAAPTRGPDAVAPPSGAGGVSGRPIQLPRAARAGISSAAALAQGCAAATRSSCDRHPRREIWRRVSRTRHHRTPPRSEPQSLRRGNDLFSSASASSARAPLGRSRHRPHWLWRLSHCRRSSPR